MSDFVSTSAISTAEDVRVAQTPENTTPPFAPLPEAAPKPEAFIASPNAKTPVTRGTNGKFQSLDPNKPRKARPSRRKKVEAAPPTTEALVPRVVAADTTAVDLMLKNLVMKLVGMENNIDYKLVWITFFRMGGVYNGPNYYEELETAVKYLRGKGM